MSASHRVSETDRPTMGLPVVVPAGADVVTVGVAIEIPAPWGRELEHRRAGFGDPLAHAIPAHITLLPPTVVPRGDVRRVDVHLRQVARGTNPFELRLQGTDTFRPVSPVVFVKVVRGAPGCDTLQQGVRTGPLVRDLAFPYHPHVTVAHDVPDEALDRALTTLREFSATFVVASFCLYEHGSDGVWRPKDRYPFGLLG